MSVQRLILFTIISLIAVTYGGPVNAQGGGSAGSRGLVGRVGNSFSIIPAGAVAELQMRRRVAGIPVETSIYSVLDNGKVTLWKYVAPSPYLSPAAQEAVLSKRISEVRNLDAAKLDQLKSAIAEIEPPAGLLTEAVDAHNTTSDWEIADAVKNGSTFNIGWYHGGRLMFHRHPKSMAVIKILHSLVADKDFPQFQKR